MTTGQPHGAPRDAVDRLESLAWQLRQALIPIIGSQEFGRVGLRAKVSVRLDPEGNGVIGLSVVAKLPESLSAQQIAQAKKAGALGHWPEAARFGEPVTLEDARDRVLAALTAASPRLVAYEVISVITDSSEEKLYPSGQR